MMIPTLFRGVDANAADSTVKAVRFGENTRTTFRSDMTEYEKDHTWYRKSELRCIRRATVRDLTDLFNSKRNGEEQSEEKCFRGLEIYVKEGSSRFRTERQEEFVQGLLRLQYVQTRQLGSLDHDAIRSYVLKASTLASISAQNLAAQDALEADYIYKYDETSPQPLTTSTCAATLSAAVAGRKGPSAKLVLALARGRRMSKPSLPNRQRSFTVRTV